MKKFKINYLTLALLISALGAFATSSKTNFVVACLTVPATNGSNINPECHYTPGLPCCYIQPGNTSQYVTQTQNGLTTIIRRHPTSMVTIFGTRFD